MKKFFVSMGLAAAGTAGLHAAYAPDLGPLSDTKLWNVSATLRGFYDDNYDTANSGLNPRGSYGFEVSPQLMLAVPLQQTELGLRDTYSMQYYQERDSLGQSAIDQSDQLDLWVDHAFTERWQAKVMDTFVVGQEPQLLTPNGQGVSLPVRVEGDNIVNTATITLNTDWTRLFSTSLNYQNSVYDYRNSGETLADIYNNYLGFQVAGASLAGLLNRVDQSVSLNFQWKIAPETMVFLGGQFELVNYIGNEPIAFSIPLALERGGNPFNPSDSRDYYYSDSRDNRSYFGYVGIQHNFLPNLNFSAKAGMQYTDDYNDPLSSASVSPYAVVSVIYTYLPGSYAEIGFNEQQNSTDVVGLFANNHYSISTGKITQNQQSSVLYGSLNHQITPKLLGTLIASWQNSVFQGGAYNNVADNYYSLGLNLSYTFTPHFSAEAGYNYDDVSSDIYQRGYSRNRVYIGVTAAY